MKDTDWYGFSLKKYGFPPRNCGVSVIGKFCLRNKCELLSYLSKMCVSTHEYHLILCKNLISQLEITEKSCYNPPPPPLNRVGSWRSRKKSATTPPTESRRLLEITEKTQEIQQPQLGSSGTSQGGRRRYPRSSGVATGPCPPKFLVNVFFLQFIYAILVCK